MKPKSNLSISLMIRYFMAVVILIVIAGTASAIVEYNLKKQEIISMVSESSAAVRFVIGEYLVNKQPHKTLEVLKKELEDRNILAIVIRDKTNGFFTGAVKDTDKNIVEYSPVTSKNLLYKALRRPVNFDLKVDNKNVGTFSIYLSDALIKEQVLFISLKYIIILAAALLLLSFFLYFNIRFMIAGPLQYMIKHLEGIKRGKLIPLPNINAKKRDEINAVSREINNMIDRYANLAHDLVTISDAISKDSDQNYQVTQEFSDIINTEATAIEQISAALIQSASSVKNISNNTQESVTKLSRGAQKAKEGFALIEKIIQSIEKIAERSENIKKSLALIYDITEETDMLALNASIEAAKAGEYGKGFAVVAEQIRKLAEKSQDTAREIENRINQNNEEVVDAKDIIKGSQETINEVLKTTVASDQILAQISIAINEQAAGQGEMLKAVDNINNSMNKIVDRVSIIEIATKAIESSSDQLSEISKPFQVELTKEEGQEEPGEEQTEEPLEAQESPEEKETENPTS